ncbi:hypothetical protein ACQCVK_07080 [Rossellomorea vietnamensis]|uniref:hypothetical protein n=1 Tax=Rossellomorea vietnamensis TaxID=218284 RepID=UPI003CF4D1CD
MDVPFTCIDERFIPGADRELKSQKSSLTHEYKYSSKNKLGGDPHKSDSYIHEYINEPIECVLTSADIMEIDLYKDYKHCRFTNLTERMEVNLWLMLVQNQERFAYHDEDAPDCPLLEDEVEEMEEPSSERKPSKTILDLIQERIDRMSS